MEKNPNLTTPEGRQEKIEKIFQEEGEKEIDVEKILAATDKQSEKIDAEIERKDSWVREKVEKTANWYKKQKLWKKVLFSAGCLGVASASAAVGGAAGAAIATAAFTGTMGQRMLGGLATFVTTEGLLKKSAEKGGRERGKWEVRRHTAEAAILGILVGSGKFVEGIRNIAEVTGAKDFLAEAYRYWFPKEELTKAQSLTGDVKVPEAPTPEPPPVPEKPTIESVVEVKKGDTIWKLAENQLKERGYFKNLTGTAEEIEVKENFLIDSVSRKVAVPSGDVNLIHTGEKIDFKNVFDDEKAMGRLTDRLDNIRPSHTPAEAPSEADAIEVAETETPKENIKENVSDKILPKSPEQIHKTEDISDRLKELEDKYREARIRLSEANAESYSSDLPKEDAQAEIDKYYKESADLEKQIQELKSSKPKLELEKELIQETKKPIVPEPAAVKPATGGESIQKIIETATETKNILPEGKIITLDKDISLMEIRGGKIFGEEKALSSVVEQIKTGKITAEDFSKYYADKTGVTNEENLGRLTKNIKESFKIIIEGKDKGEIKRRGIMNLLEFLKRKQGGL